MSRAIMWFRNDLRLEDNPALLAAAQSADSLLCLYVVEPRWFIADNWQSRRLGDHGWRFLCQSLIDLDLRLQRLGQQLVIRFGDPQTVIPQLMRNHWVNQLFCSAPFGYDERQQFLTIKQQIGERRCHAVETWTLFTLNQLPFSLDDVPSTFSQFRKLMAPLQPRDLLQSPNKLPAPLSIDSDPLPPPHSMVKQPFVGGESAGQTHSHSYFASTSPQRYKVTRNAIDDWGSSTKLSPWLAHGCLSANSVWQYLLQHESVQGRNDNTDWIRVELLWREYFQWLTLAAEQKMFAFGGTQGIRRPTCFYPERFKLWCHGKTPYPIVNAAMNQLNATGYISNRARQLVASAFVHELSLDWRFGAAYFQQQLIDHDVGCNWGNWQYLAGVGQDPRGWRQFDLAKQTEIYDPDGSYVRRWQGAEHHPLDSNDGADWPKSHCL